MDKRILQCDLHDYLEIACLFGIEVELILKDGSSLTGLPITTRADSKTGEFLEFDSKQPSQRLSIPLLSLKSMHAVHKNPHFNTIEFSSS